MVLGDAFAVEDQVDEHHRAHSHGVDVVEHFLGRRRVEHLDDARERHRVQDVVGFDEALVAVLVLDARADGAAEIGRAHV